jgi:hypothetical protein
MRSHTSGAAQRSPSAQQPDPQGVPPGQPGGATQVVPEHVSPSRQQRSPHGTGHGVVLARVQVPAMHASALSQQPSPQTTSPGSQQRPLAMQVLPAEQQPPGRS